MPDTPSIDVRHLRKVYGEIVAVDDLTFTVPRGAVLGLLGGNGAGKTTTIAMLLGLLEPTAGEIRVLGVDMLRRRYAALPRMNFSSPYVDLPHRLTVRQNLAFYGRLYGVKDLARRIEEIAEHMQVVAVPRSPGRQAVGRPEDARGARQGADQPARGAAARRADGLARSRHRRLGARLPQGLPARDPAPRSCSPRTTWARSSGCATT